MIFGYFWVFLGIFGYFWVLLGIFGYFWVLYCIDIVPILISYRYCIDILTYRTALEEEIFCLSYPDARDCCPLGLVCLASAMQVTHRFLMTIWERKQDAALSALSCSIWPD